MTSERGGVFSVTGEGMASLDEEEKGIVRYVRRMAGSTEAIWVGSWPPLELPIRADSLRQKERYRVRLVGVNRIGVGGEMHRAELVTITTRVTIHCHCVSCEGAKQRRRKNEECILPAAEFQRPPPYSTIHIPGELRALSTS